MRLWGEFSQYRATVSAERTLKEFKQSKGRVFVQFGEFLQYRAPFCNCARRPLLESDERLIFSVNYLDNAGIPVLVFVRMVPYMQCIHFSISFLSGISVINKYNPVWNMWQVWSRSRWVSLLMLVSLDEFVRGNWADVRADYATWALATWATWAYLSATLNCPLTLRSLNLFVVTELM